MKIVKNGKSKRKKWQNKERIITEKKEDLTDVNEIKKTGEKK